MRKTILIGMVTLLGLTLALPSASAASVPSECGGQRDRGELSVIGLTADQSLICFGVKDPEDATTIGSVAGLQTDTALVGIDHRPATGELYGLGNAGGLYILDTTNAVASYRARLNMPLSGTDFGVDFNPTVDRLRVVSDTGQNLRVNVTDGVTTMDSSLNYVGPPPVNPALGVTGAAYTNNDADPNTATTLYDIDSSLDQVVIQAPPNAGPLSPTGKLTVDTASKVGSDIYSRLRNGTTVSVKGFASLTTSRGSVFYRINLVTGKATPRGVFDVPVIGIAVPLNQI